MSSCAHGKSVLCSADVKGSASEQSRTKAESVHPASSSTSAQGRTIPPSLTSLRMFAALADALDGSGLIMDLIRIVQIYYSPPFVSGSSHCVLSIQDPIYDLLDHNRDPMQLIWTPDTYTGPDMIGFWLAGSDYYGSSHHELHRPDTAHKFHSDGKCLPLESRRPGAPKHRTPAYDVAGFEVNGEYRDSVGSVFVFVVKSDDQYKGLIAAMAKSEHRSEWGSTTLVYLGWAEGLYIFASKERTTYSALCFVSEADVCRYTPYVVFDSCCDAPPVNRLDNLAALVPHVAMQRLKFPNNVMNPLHGELVNFRFCFGYLYVLSRGYDRHKECLSVCDVDTGELLDCVDICTLFWAPCCAVCDFSVSTDAVVLLQGPFEDRFSHPGYVAGPISLHSVVKFSK